MTGPEHYRRAEELLDEATTGWSADRDPPTIAMAQAHATLALAAAVGTMNPKGVSRDSADSPAWRKVVGGNS